MGYLIGGITEKSMPSASFGHANNNWFVIEADEYDSAFFDKRPKFLHYWPKWVLVNNIEHDHVDIFSDLEAMQKQYQLLMRTVHPDGGVIDPEIVPDSSAIYREIWNNAGKKMRTLSEVSTIG